MQDVFTIKLDIADVPKFVDSANAIPNNVNLVQNSTVASGKSLIGLFSLDLSKEIKLIVYDRDSDDLVYKRFGQWIVNKKGENS